MKTLKFLLLFILFFSIKSHARHIVGGEVRLVYLGVGDNYKIILNLYFDNLKGVPAAVDKDINVGVYNKISHQRVGNFKLTRDLQVQNVPYASGACQTGSLSTGIIVYTREVSLNPDIYRSLGGYIMVWERCCRTNDITNIYVPDEMSNTFYAEFPPIRRNGVIFRNSTPNLGVPPGDYLCINNPVSINFGGTDADGDALVYSLTTPFDATVASPGNARPFDGQNIPANYYYNVVPTVNFLPGYSATAAILSNVAGGELTIDASTGVLTVTPNEAGLFVFSVKCEEFRAGVKIGEVRRDYQFLVKVCPSNSLPTLTLNTPQNQPYIVGNEMVIDVEANDPLCFSLNIKDTPNEIISQIKLIPAIGSENFTAADYTISANNINLGTSGISNNVTICWNKCKVNTSTTARFVFDVEIRDGGCPNVGIAKQRVVLNVKGKINTKPKINIIGSSPSFNTTTLIGDVLIGEDLFIDLSGIDIDNDSIRFSANDLDVDFGGVGATFTSISGKGRATAQFKIKPNCNNVNTNGHSDTLQFKFILKESGGDCQVLRDSIEINIIIKDAEVDLSTFTPYNVFTPNEDAKNAYYALDNLPKDNCIYNFRNFTVYNRWGKRIYETTDKNFKWEAKNSPAGLYYYYLDYNQKQYKGSISILY